MTARPLIFHPDLDPDLEDATAYYRERNAQLPERFGTDYRNALQLIREHPLSGRTFFEGFRRVYLRRFPYFVAYQVTEERVIVLAVLPGLRDPEWIRAQLEERA